MNRKQDEKVLRNLALGSIVLYMKFEEEIKTVGAKVDNKQNDLIKEAKQKLSKIYYDTMIKELAKKYTLYTPPDKPIFSINQVKEILTKLKEGKNE